MFSWLAAINQGPVKKTNVSSDLMMALCILRESAVASFAFHGAYALGNACGNSRQILFVASPRMLLSI